MNLQERLQAELIGTTTDATVLVRDEDRQTAFGMNRIREVQRKIVPDLAATIAADLKGMLPKVYGQPDSDLLVNAVKEGHNEAVRTMSAAIDRYCGVNQDKQENPHHDK